MTSAKHELVAVASLVKDFTLYPRHKLNPTNVREIAEAMEAGATMPPLVADRATRRIVDGFHRVDAALRGNGDNATAMVEWRDYANDGEMFLDAVRLNARHGQKLAPWDRARIIAMASGLSIDTDTITAALAITKERYADLEIHKTAIVNAEVVPIKGTVRHLHGQSLTVTQQQGMIRAGGMNVSFYVDQVINAIEHDLIDDSNPGLRQRLERLTVLLQQRKVA